jgi:hypothetical protein
MELLQETLGLLLLGLAGGLLQWLLTRFIFKKYHRPLGEFMDNLWGNVGFLALGALVVIVGVQLLRHWQ